LIEKTQTRKASLKFWIFYVKRKKFENKIPSPVQVHSAKLTIMKQLEN